MNIELVLHSHADRRWEYKGILSFNLTVCYLGENDVTRNKVVIKIVDESNNDRSLNIATPTEELLVPPENRLEIRSSQMK